MTYKLVIHRDGMREVLDEFDSFEEAAEFGESGRKMGEFFLEYILNDNDVIVYDGIDLVIGREREMVVIGTVYQRGKEG